MQYPLYFYLIINHNKLSLYSSMSDSASNARREANKIINDIYKGLSGGYNMHGGYMSGGICLDISHSYITPMYAAESVTTRASVPINYYGGFGSPNN